MPGKADFVVFRAPGQAKTKHQNRHMVMTLGEAFESFKHQNPDQREIKVCRAPPPPPLHVLLTSQMPHNVCGCRYYNNVVLLLEGFHRRCPAIPLYRNDDFLSLRACDVQSEVCTSNNCDNCSDGQLFERNIAAPAGDMDAGLNWDFWGLDREGYLVRHTKTGTV